jgi:hypothetical protein
MATPPDELFHAQEREVGRYTDQRVKRLLAMLESARRDLRGVIAEPESFTAQRVLSLTQQIDDISRQLRGQVQQIGASTYDLAQMTKRHLEASIAAIQPNVQIAIGALNTDSLMRFSMNELENVTKITDQGLATIKSVLFTKVGVQGQNPAQVARQLAGKDGMFAGKFGHIETIMRTETSTVYNAQSLSGIEFANNNFDLALNKRIVETIDSHRNHPISQVLNGQVQAVDGEFRASVSAVAAKAAKLHKGTGGIFWPIKGGYYVGQRLPAHYRERGIVTPTEREINVPD